MNELLEKEVLELEGIARDLRVKSLRMIHRRQAGHPGGSLSAAEIVAVLYFKVLPGRPAASGMAGTGPLILSKGHASCPPVCRPCHEGYFPPADLEGWGGAGLQPARAP